MAKKEKTEEKTGRSPQEILKSVLDANKEHHDNYSDEVEAPIMSTGSLFLDLEMKGGMRSAGLVRPVGFTEGGKTSESLELARNFMAVNKKARTLLVKAEGRLHPEMVKRTGLKFITNENWDEWEEGTIFVLDTGDYELVLELLRSLVNENEDGNRYCFILDSMDALILRSDAEKKLTEANKVAGAPALTKKFLQRLARAMNRFGHLCIMIGQVSSKIEIDDSGREVRQIAATGGNAALHWSNWILQFEPRFNGDRIMDDPDKPYDATKNKIYGHWCKVRIMKSPNETSNKVVRYPIKYGRVGKSSIWRELEIATILTKFRIVEVNGSWITMTPEIINTCKEAGYELKPKIQGTNQLCDYLEENPAIADILCKYCMDYMLNQPSL